MSTEPDITIRPEMETWALVIFPFVMSTIVFVMFYVGISPYLWVSLALILTAIWAQRFRAPAEIVFRTSSRTMELRYRTGRRPDVYTFDELSYVRSRIDTSGDGDACFQLAVTLKNGQRIPLKRELGTWDPSSPWWRGMSGAREPHSLTDLRRKIASVAGIQDFGSSQ